MSERADDNNGWVHFRHDLREPRANNVAAPLGPRLIRSPRRPGRPDHGRPQTIPHGCQGAFGSEIDYATLLKE